MAPSPTSDSFTWNGITWYKVDTSQNWEAVYSNKDKTKYIWFGYGYGGPEYVVRGYCLKDGTPISYYYEIVDGQVYCTKYIQNQEEATDSVLPQLCSRQESKDVVLKEIEATPTHTISVGNMNTTLVNWTNQVSVAVIGSKSGLILLRDNPTDTAQETITGTFREDETLTMYVDYSHGSFAININGTDILYGTDKVSTKPDELLPDGWSAYYPKDLSSYKSTDMTINGFYLCCLPYYTQIETRDNGIKTISDIQVGEWIKSWNFEKHEPTYVEVLHKSSPIRDNLIKTSFADGSYYEITNNHVVYTDQGWACWSPEKCKDVENPIKIAVGQKVLLSTGEYEEITNVEYIEYPEGIQCYMLNVTDGNDTFFFIQQGTNEREGGGGINLSDNSLHTTVPQRVPQRNVSPQCPREMLVHNSYSEEPCASPPVDIVPIVL